MGYTTDFYGQIDITPPLNEHEASYLQEFNRSRRMERTFGPYFVKGDGDFGQGNGPDTILGYNSSHNEQPGLWCQWVPGDGYTATDSGHKVVDYGCLEWDQGEKFYQSAEWMKYLIDHFLKPNAMLQERLKNGWFEQNGYPVDERFAHFTFDHVLNGEIEAQGEDHGDRWYLIVENNIVKVADVQMTRGTATEL